MKSALPRLVLLLVALGAVVGLIIWMQRRADQTPEGQGLVTSDAAANWETQVIKSAASAPVSSPRAPQRTVVDKQRRDQIRELIYKAYGRTPPPAPPKPARQQEHAPLGNDAGRISPEYVQSRIREDFVPMAKECYEAALERDPKLAGKIVLSFVIVGDENVGGIVESAEITKGTTIEEEELSLCLRESMLSMSFVPPENGGSVTVTYPFGFSPGDGG